MTSRRIFDNINSHVKAPNCIETLRKKNEELNNDISVLKKLVYLLNVELELRESASKNTQTLASIDSRPRKNYLASSDIRSIEPLLRAFEESKKEKDDLLMNYKQAFDEFSNRCKEIASENSSLRQQLQEHKEKAESNLMEWKKLHEKFILTEEHNELLTRQVKLLQNKNRDEEIIFQDKLRQSNEEIKELNEKLQSSRSELYLLQSKVNALTEVKNRHPIEAHAKQDNFSPYILTEMKKLSFDLKNFKDREIPNLNTRLKTLESLKCDLEIKLATVTSERDHLLGQISVMKSEARQTNLKFKTLENELQVAKKNENDTRLELMKSIAFIRELVSCENSKTSISKEVTNVDSKSNHLE